MSFEPCWPHKAYNWNSGWLSIYIMWRHKTFKESFPLGFFMVCHALIWKFVFWFFWIFCLKTNVVWMSQHESNRKASFCLKYVVALKPMCMADNSSHPTIFLDLRTTTTDWSFRAMLYMALETLLSLTYFSAFEIQIVHPFRTIVYQSWFLAIPWITSYLVCNLARLQTY